MAHPHIEGTHGLVNHDVYTLVDFDYVQPLIRGASPEVLAATGDLVSLSQADQTENKQVVLDFISRSLVQLEKNPFFTETITIRGHHADSRKFMIEQLIAAHLLSPEDIKAFCHTGIFPGQENPALYRMVGEDQLGYFLHILNDAQKDHPDYDYHVNGHEMSYSFDQFGYDGLQTDPKAALRWMLSNSYTNVRWLRLPGKTPVTYTVLPDEICGGCDKKVHCGWRLRRGSNSQEYDPDEVPYLQWYQQNAVLLPDEQGEIQQPEVIAVAETHLKTGDRKSQQIELPVAVETTLRDMRYTLLTQPIPTENN